MLTIEKQPLVIEDLGKHAPEDIDELRFLLEAGIVGHADLRRPYFYEVDGAENVYSIFRYPAEQKVLLIATRQKVWVASKAAA